MTDLGIWCRRGTLAAVLIGSAVLGLIACREIGDGTATGSIPHLDRSGQAVSWIIENRPFIALAGELHNSSGSSLAYMEGVWKKLEGSGLNTVIVPVSWELTEPVEGEFNFAIIDGLIEGARAHGFKLIVTWFGSWKNGSSSYVPRWVKSNPERFPGAQDRDGNRLDALSVFGEESWKADARAFRALMEHLRTVDNGHQTVAMVQVENEVGLLGSSRDYSPLANTAFSGAVPDELIQGLDQKMPLMDGLATAMWLETGRPSSGTWAEVFGGGLETDEIFMSWYYARYLDQVAAAGKAVYPIPLFANAWLVSPGEPDPGDYPSGGPIARELVVWQIAAPNLDILAPDIYLEDFKRITDTYHRGGNALVIPEVTGDVWFALDDFRRYESSRNVFWALAAHDALVFAPFGIEGLPTDDPLFDSYRTLGPLLPLISEYRGTGRMAGILETRENSNGEELAFGDYLLSIRYNQKRIPGDVAYGLIIQTDQDHFLIAGYGFTVSVAAAESADRLARISQIDEGTFEEGQWVPLRRLNGDESAQHRRVQLPPTTWDSFDNRPGPRVVMLEVIMLDGSLEYAPKALQDITQSQPEG